MIVTLHMDDAVYAQALARAGSLEALVAGLEARVTRYAAVGSIHAQGGRARADALTPAQRQQSARRAACARWAL